MQFHALWTWNLYSIFNPELISTCFPLLAETAGVGGEKYENESKLWLWLRIDATCNRSLIQYLTVVVPPDSTRWWTKVFVSECQEFICGISNSTKVRQSHSKIGHWTAARRDVSPTSHHTYPDSSYGGTLPRIAGILLRRPANYSVRQKPPHIPRPPLHKSQAGQVTPARDPAAHIHTSYSWPAPARAPTRGLTCHVSANIRPPVQLSSTHCPADPRCWHGHGPKLRWRGRGEKMRGVSWGS